ncbi:MAG: hypothetical protein GWP14_04645 [Actinobacteria bacterium]|nr:hypothetical protein [Actinomycetota bacterium]
MTEDLDNTIRDNASSPRRARGDSGEMEQHNLKDQIEADRYLNSKQAVKNGLGIRLTKLVPPGAS